MMTFEETVSDLKHSSEFARGFDHADGSFTGVAYDPYGCDGNSPRDFDGNVASLVSLSRDYVDLDDADNGIEEARDRWDGNEAMVARYVAMLRPDIALYVDRWEVTGNSQGDWQYGWAYVTVDALAEAGLTVEDAQSAFDAEVKVYGQYFAGEVYTATHVIPGEQYVTVDMTGETANCRHCDRLVEWSARGIWVDPEATGDDSLWHECCDANDEDRIAAHEPTREVVSDETVHGFLGYDKPEDIAAEMTDSPVVEVHWS